MLSPKTDLTVDIVAEQFIRSCRCEFLLNWFHAQDIPVTISWQQTDYITPGVVLVFVL